MPEKTRDSAFAERLDSACRNNPNVPIKYHGQASWLREQLAKRFNISVSAETLSKWFNGEMKPRERKMRALAEILAVDVAWLSLGIDPGMTPRERKTRTRMAGGAINLIAGYAQMDGAAVAFPTERDSEAVDLYAIIKGVNHAFHVALGEQAGDNVKFKLHSALGNVMVLGVTRREGFDIAVAELPLELIEEQSQHRGGAREITVPLAWFEDHLIKDFTERL